MIKEMIDKEKIKCIVKQLFSFVIQVQIIIHDKIRGFVSNISSFLPIPVLFKITRSIHKYIYWVFL